MTRRRPDDTVRAVGLFCGAGGLSWGLARACEQPERDVELAAINHWEVAILASTIGSSRDADRTARREDHAPAGRRLYRPGISNNTPSKPPKSAPHLDLEEKKSRNDLLTALGYEEDLGP